MKKRMLIWLVLIVLIMVMGACGKTPTTTTTTPTTTGTTTTATTTTKKNGYNFLIDNLNNSINLIRESPDTGAPQDETYWLLTDNFLASYALKSYNLELSTKIMSAIEKYGYEHDHYIEILFGNRTVEPNHAIDTTPKIILQNNDYIIQTETVTDKVMLDYAQYLDKICYEALWYAYGGNLQEANILFNQAKEMWDGKGFKDIVTTTTTTDNSEYQYQTYKLAVFYYTARVLGKLDTVQFKDTLLSTINGLQDTNGGYHTSYKYDENGKLQIVGSTNTETTSLVLIALNYEPKPLP